MRLPPCWQITGCGREGGGRNEAELGTCAAYPNHGHSCWAVVGTLCGGQVRGALAQKRGSCITCQVYKRYSPGFGTDKQEVAKQHPEEHATAIRVLGVFDLKTG
jgi:hypothetical protein